MNGIYLIYLSHSGLTMVLESVEVFLTHDFFKRKIIFKLKSKYKNIKILYIYK